MLFFLTFLWAIRMPQCFTLGDYEKLAQKYNQLSQSVCLVRNRLTGVQLTGVLIHPHIVLTAAHGFSPKHAYFSGPGWLATFPNGVSVGISAVNVPQAYVDVYTNPASQFGKVGHDMAFCQLSAVPQGVTPVPLDDGQDELQDDDLLLGMTYRDQRLLAFHLPEFTAIHAHGATDTSGYTGKIYGSVFFNPQGKSYANNPFLEEKEQRPCIARHYWNYHHHLPYALSLPGVSGSPVFKVDPNSGQGVVVALVSGFTSIDKSMQLPYRNAAFFAQSTALKNLYDQFQTLFVRVSVDNLRTC